LSSELLLCLLSRELLVYADYLAYARLDKSNYLSYTLK